MLGNDPIETQKSLSDKKIGIVGCGGIGNLVSVNLATAGVNNFILCDEDDIETSNLSRQIMFSENDIGKQKVDQLAVAIKKRASFTNIKSIKKKILSPKDLIDFKECDLIIVSADKGGVVNHVNQFCIENNVNYINVGYVNDIAVWGPLVIPGKTGCYACGDVEAGESKDENLQQLLSRINQEYQAPSIGPVNMLASSLASLDIVKHLTGMPDIHSLNKRVGLWTNTLKFETQDCSKNPNCRVCS
jgi:molybdopterin/thiamine biosynthesis adenylyltransferase